jgi:hypothetical protein
MNAAAVAVLYCLEMRYHRLCVTGYGAAPSPAQNEEGGPGEARYDMFRHINDAPPLSHKLRPKLKSMHFGRAIQATGRTLIRDSGNEERKQSHPRQRAMSLPCRTGI